MNAIIRTGIIASGRIKPIIRMRTTIRITIV